MYFKFCQNTGILKNFIYGIKFYVYAIQYTFKSALSLTLIKSATLIKCAPLIKSAPLIKYAPLKHAPFFKS